MSKAQQPCKTSKKALKSSYAYQHDDILEESAKSKLEMLKRIRKSKQNKSKQRKKS